MKRWFIGLLVLLAFGAAGGGLWYLGSGPEKPTTPAPKATEAFLPEDPQLLVRFNHNREALSTITNVAMVERFKESRFQKALTNRIQPLLSLVSDQFRANTPYPSQQLLRYFQNSVSFLTKARGEQPVFLMTPSKTHDDRDPSNLRDLIEEWILSPARNRSNWTVHRSTVRDNPIWKLTYTFPGNYPSISFHLATVDHHGLISFSSNALKNSLGRYNEPHKPSYTLANTKNTRLVDFLVTHNTPDTDASLLENNRTPIPSDSAKTLRGSVSVQRPYVGLNARVAFPDTIPVNNIPIPRDLLSYFPPESYALNVLAVPSFDDKTPEEYRRLLRHRGQSLLPGRQPLMRVVDSLEGLELLESQKILGFASFYSDVSDAPSPSFLLTLKPRNPAATRDQLEQYRQSKPSEPPQTSAVYEFGTIDAHGLWHNQHLLLSDTESIVTEARARRLNREGFANHENFRRIADRVPNRLTSFSYFTTSPLTFVLRDGKPIRNSRYQLAKTFLGFDPVREIATMVEGAPPNFLVTRREKNRNVSLKFYTAGDVFLPLALQRLNPEYRPDLSELPLDIPSGENPLIR